MTSLIKSGREPTLWMLNNTGVAWRGGKLTGEGAGRGRFKTPTLREIARTAPCIWLQPKRKVSWHS